jgi:hypothetical protein
MNKALTKKRTCSKCRQVNPLTVEFFARNQSTNTGGDKYFRPECKKCTSKASKGKSKALKLYKLNGGLPAYQGQACDRCRRTDKKLVFDHCHITFVHRGWLCDNCNRAMGMLGDNIEGQLLSTIYIAKTTNIGMGAVIMQLKKLWKKK